MRIIVVTYNSLDIIRECLDSIRMDVESGLAEVVVVDNESHDGTPKMLESEYQWAQVVRTGANRGYGAGNNYGAAGSVTDYLMILNPDARLLPFTLDLMIQTLDKTPEAAIAGPKIVDQDGITSLSYHPFTTPGISIIQALGLYRILPFNHTDGKVEIIRHAPEKLVEVDRLIGAVFLMRRNAFEDLRGFDERFFLYSEEEDLCLRAHKRGYKVLFQPTASAVHLESRSLEPSSPLAIASTVWSRQHFIEKHYPGPGAVLSRVAWVAGLVMKWIAAFILPIRALRSRRNGFGAAIMSLMIKDYYDKHVRPDSRRVDIR